LKFEGEGVGLLSEEIVGEEKCRSHQGKNDEGRAQEEFESECSLRFDVLGHFSHYLFKL